MLASKNPRPGSHRVHLMSAATHLKRCPTRKAHQREAQRPRLGAAHLVHSAQHVPRFHTVREKARAQHRARCWHKQFRRSEPFLTEWWKPPQNQGFRYQPRVTLK